MPTEAGLNYLCAGYKDFFTYVDETMRVMAQYLAQQQASANMMLYMHEKDKKLDALFAKAGRNDPSPCSSLKFKKCQGRRS